MSNTNNAVTGGSLEFVDSERMAEAAGMGVASFRVALTRSKKRRDANRSIPTDIPAPDRQFGRSPVWRKESMEKWIAERSLGFHRRRSENIPSEIDES